MKKLLYKIMPVVVLMILLASAIVPNQINYVSAANYKAMCVVDNNGEVLYQYNKDAKLAMASTTKIVTAIVAIENTPDLDKVVTVADQSVGVEGTSLYLRKGEQMSIRNLLYGLILPSGNDAAVALAYAVSGSEEKFVELMNDFAKKLELTNTSFANPHGLDQDGHYTSAHDLAKIAAYAIKNPTFVDITSTKSIVLNEGQPNVRYLKNKNKLVYSQDGNIGGKIGFTDNAGRCLVNYAERDGLQVVSVVLNCGPMFEECAKYTEMAYDTFMLKTFIEPYSYAGTINILDGEKADITVVGIKGFDKVIKIEEQDRYNVEYDLPNELSAPVKNGDVVGKVNVLFDNEVIYTQELIAIYDVENINLKHKLDNIIENWYL